VTGGALPTYFFYVVGDARVGAGRMSDVGCRIGSCVLSEVVDSKEIVTENQQLHPAKKKNKTRS
jgi:hypothetical protein